MKLADIHYERNGVQSDFIEESYVSTEGMKDLEVEEEIQMEEERNLPTPITGDNLAWLPVLKQAVKIGAAKRVKLKEKTKKNLLGLKKTTEKPQKLQRPKGG